MEQRREVFLCDPAAARQARGMLEGIERRLSQADTDTASLVLTELVTNAVRHGCEGPGSRITVEVSRDPGWLRIEVSQPGPLFDLDEIRLGRPGRERGWGVLLVDRLTTSWGVGSSGVWAEIALRE